VDQDPRRRVLVIEDDTDLRALVRVHRLGYQAIEAATGETGVQLAREHRPDAVLVDYVLPGIDGRQILVALRADHRTAAARVVVMSSMDEDQHRVQADAVLTKPFSRSDLAAALAGVLEPEGR
jgi:DNA-binding response OmpR family regulator